jgi:hypothetical protein
MAYCYFVGRSVLEDVFLLELSGFAVDPLLSSSATVGSFWRVLAK